MHVLIDKFQKNHFGNLNKMIKQKYRHEVNSL